MGNASSSDEATRAKDGMLRRGTFAPRDNEVDWVTLPGFGEKEACQALLGRGFAFDAVAGEWKSGDDVDDAEGETPPLPDKLTIISYNIWFAEEFWEERLDELVRLTQGADVLCLQEVTTQALFRLRDSAEVRERFILSEVSGWSVHRYGVVILVRKGLPLSGFRIIDMASNMGRRILIAEFRSGTVALATVHLESLASAPVRKAQLQVASRLLAGFDTALLCGDFNITATGTFGDPVESAGVLEVLGQKKDGWGDIWVEQCLRETPLASALDCETRDDAYTFDVVANKMLQPRGLAGAAEERGRIDRACARGVNMDACSVRVIGNEPLETQPAGAERPVFPSDHFGLEIILCPSSSPIRGEKS